MAERALAAKTTEAKKEVSASRMQMTEHSPSSGSPAERILYLQRTIGNQAVQRLIKSGALQAKLRLGVPGDAYEQEADRVAEQVVRMPEPKVSGKISDNPIQRACPKCTDHHQREEILQSKEISGSVPEITPELEANINTVRAGGQPLPESVRAFFEPRFGHDFSGVRVHTDAKAAEAARAVNAKAFTVGRDVVFEEGEYATETSEGRQLLAHELYHVIQQRRAGLQVQLNPGDETEPPNPIASWIHPSDSLLLIQADDRLFILPARNLVWVPDAASQAAIHSAIPHLATDLGALMEAPATGASGTRIFRAGRRAALMLDAGTDPQAAIPAAVYLNEIQGVMANLGVRNVSEIRPIHVHKDHISGIPTIIANSRVRADRVVIPQNFIGVNRDIQQVVANLQGTTNPDLVARGFGSAWMPGTVLRDRGGDGDIFRYRYPLGELVVESIALRSALRTVGANPDLASFLTKVTRPADRASIIVLGDLRGRDLTAIRNAMEAQRAGSWNEFFSGVTTLSGFSHHAGRMEDRDVAGMMSLLDATLLREGQLRVIEQTSRTTHGQARSDTLELMQRLGVETAVVELPTPGRASGTGVTRDTLYTRGPSATRLGALPSSLTAGLGRIVRLQEARRTIDIWRPWFIELGGQQAEQFINNLIPEVDRSEATLRAALRNASEAALRVRTGGDVTASGGRDYSAAGGIRGQAFDTALGAIPTTTPAEIAITNDGFDKLRRLRELPESEIPLRVAVHAAMVRGIYSDQAFAHMLSELEPARRSELLTGRRGGASPRQVAFRRVRAEFNFRRSVLGSGDVMSIPGNWSPGARVATAGVAWFLLALELWSDVAQPLLEAQQTSKRRFTGENLLPFLRRLVFWGQMGVRPALVGVVDPTFGSPSYEMDFNVVIKRLNSDSPWDALYIQEPGLSDLDVMRMGVWLSFNVRNYDEFALLFIDSGQDAVTWENPGGSGWENAQWKVRIGRYETSGTNHVEESWYPHPRLTQLMNRYVQRIISNTGSLLSEWGKRGAFSEESEAYLGSLEIGGHPLSRSTLRQNTPTTEVWVQPLGSIGAIHAMPPERLRREVTWWSPPQFFVYDTDSNGYTKVGGADYNTYAILRSLQSERHTQVYSAGGVIGADEVTIIGNESGTVWIRSDLLA